MIYFIQEAEGFAISHDEKSAVASLLPAVIVEDGQEYPLPLVGAEGDTAVYRANGIEVHDAVRPEGGGLFSVTRHIVNLNAHRRRIKSIFEVETAFVPTHYVIPCVNYNGNAQGNRDTPTGLTRDGKPWVFAYDRVGIPSCTVSEDRETGVALFASPHDSDSLRSACSLIQEEGGAMRHRIFHPVTEAPLTYASKRIMREPYEDYMTLVPGGIRTLKVYVYLCHPRWENYACAALQDRVLDLFRPQKSPALRMERVWELGIAYSDALLRDCHGHTMSYTNTAPRLFAYQHMAQITPQQMAVMMEDPYYTVLGQFGNRFEVGWADQGAMYARMRAVDAWRRKDWDRLHQAGGILDDWVASQQACGLFYPQYQNNFPDDETPKADPDACNMGWAMTELTRAYQFFASIGIDKPAWFAFVEKLCQFAFSHYSDEWGFGKSWTIDGEPRQTEGAVGGFLVSGLLVAYEILRDERCIAFARRAMAYYKKDIDKFECAAGALDCTSIDKETSFPFVRAALSLYRLTREKAWLEWAEKAAYYFFSWMFYYECFLLGTL